MCNVMLSRQTNLLLELSLLILTVSLAGCQPTETTEIEQAADLVVGVLSLPASIDPHINTAPEWNMPLRNIYDTLVYRDVETLEFVPGLAKSWQISPDGLVYTFVLRNDVTFHDGTQFDADAVRMNLERILSPELETSVARQLLGPLMRMDVHDQFSISLVLSEPFAPLLDGLSQPNLGIASPAALAASDVTTYQYAQVGTGPYQFVEYMTNDRLILERNTSYTWGPAIVANASIPAIERVVFRIYPDQEVRMTALLDGEIQIMTGISPDNYRELDSRPEYAVQSLAMPGQPLQLLFNINRAPTSNVAVRQALIYATDRQAVAQSIFQGNAPIAYGPLSASTLYYSPELEGLYSYDPVQAVALFNSTGWTDTDEDGWRDRDGAVLEIDILVPPWGQAPALAQVIKNQWEEVLDVRVNVKQVASLAMLSEHVNAGQYSAVVINSSGVDPAILNDSYSSTGRYSWTNYINPELDNLLAAAMSELDPQRRALRYAEIQDLVMDEALILPVCDQVNLTAVHNRVLGLHFDNSGRNLYLIDAQYAEPR